MSNRFHTQISAILLLILLVFWPIASNAQTDGAVATGGDRPPIRFAVLAFRPKPEMTAKWQPLIDHLNGLGNGRHFVLTALTYAELEEAVRQKQVDVVLTQPAHYILLAHREGLYWPLATVVERAANHELPQFGGAILVRSDRQDIQTLTDLRGKRIATSQMDSLGSYQMQALELKREQVLLPADATVIETGQPQDKAVDALLNGSADVAFVRTGVLEAMVKKGKLAANQVKVVHPTAPSHDFPLAASTALYPEWPLAIMPWMDDELARWLAAAVLSLPHNGEVAQAIGISGFAIPLDYGPVESLMRELRLPPFDSRPEITISDVFNKYHTPLMLLMAVGIALSLTVALMLHRGNRRLVKDKAQIDRMVEQLRASEIALESTVSRLKSESEERKAFALELSRTNVDLSRLSEVMAHHFREPTRRLACLAQLLLSKSSLAQDPESRELLDFINQQARRLTELVGDAQRYLALDHTRVGADGTADSGAILRHCIAVAGAATTGVEISLQEPLPKVGVAEKYLDELFAILLDNSLRYRPLDRPLRIKVSASVTGERAVFRFADDGNGIAEEYREKVFELFTRLVPNSIPGTGMGLALVRKIVQRTGGGVSVEDGIEGRGTTIVFDLPLAAQDINGVQAA